MNLPEKTILVLGAGYGGITAALRLARLFCGREGYRILLVDRNPYHTLKTELHVAAARRREVTIDIGRLIRNRNVRFQLAEVTGLDTAERCVETKEGRIPFHIVLLALGSRADFYAIPGLAEHSFPLQTAEEAERIHAHVAAMTVRASSEPDPERRREMLRFVVGGGGLSGVEFAAELAETVAASARDYRIPEEEIEILLVEARPVILPALGAPLREKILETLREKKVRVLTGTKILRCEPDTVTLSDGARLASRMLVWTGGIRITQIARDGAIGTGPLGRILVDRYLRSVDFPFVYAIGDDALAIDPKRGEPVPAAAQFALQQGRLAAENIHADCFGAPRRIYQPRVWGEVVSLGRHLAAGWLALPFSGRLRFGGFLASLAKSAVEGKHVLLLRKESRNWMRRF